MPGLNDRRDAAPLTHHRRTLIRRATTILVLATLVLAACGSSTASPTPEASPTPRPGDVGWKVLGTRGIAAESMMPSDIAVNHGTVVVVGQGASQASPGESTVKLPIWSSTDGGIWTQATIAGSASGAPQSVVAFEGGFVAVGADACSASTYAALTLRGCRPAIWRSTDGVAWSRVSAEAPANAQLTAVTGWSGGLVAVGARLVTVGTTQLQRAVVFHSADGTTWEQDLPSDVPDGPLTDVASDGKTLIAVGPRIDTDRKAHAAAWSSTDGTAWTREVLFGASAGSRWVSVSTLPGGFGALDVQPTPSGSVSGLAWRRDTEWHSVNGLTAISGGHLLSIASGPFGGIVIGLDEAYRPVLYGSQDGATWGPVSPVGEMPAERFALVAATWADGRFVVSGIDLATRQLLVLVGMAYVPRPGEIAYVTPVPTPTPSPMPTPQAPPMYTTGSVTATLPLIEGFTATKQGAARCVSAPGGTVPQQVELYDVGTAAGQPVRGSLAFQGVPANGSAVTANLTMVRLDNSGATDTSWNLKGSISALGADGMSGTVKLPGTAGSIAWACDDWVDPAAIGSRTTVGHLGQISLSSSSAGWKPSAEPAQCMSDWNGGVAQVSGVLGSYRNTSISINLPLRGGERAGQRLVATLNGQGASEQQVRALVTLDRLGPNLTSGSGAFSLRFAVPLEGWPDRLDGTLAWRCPGRTDTPDKPMAACAVASSAPVGVNLAAGRESTVSKELASEPRSQAFDGDLNRAWNSGDYAIAWIEVDLGKAVQVGEVRLAVAQTPAGHTEHHLYGRTADGAPLIQLTACGGETNDQQTLVLKVSPGAKPVRYLRIETVASPSWIAWREIEVYAAG